MPRSKIYLPDVNFWLALSAESHVFHPAARSWFEAAADGSLAFCRVTQMGLLRLVTNERLLQEHTLSQSEAWRLYEELERDRRVRFASEDDTALPVHWKRFSLGPLSGRNQWTDAYLAAFAEVRGWSVATFDRDFKKLQRMGSSVEYLGDDRP